MASDDFDKRIAGVASLAEPQRRSLYQFVVSRTDAVSKDEAAKLRKQLEDQGAGVEVK